MALMHCPECGKEISVRAPQCIHCGYPLHESSNGSSSNSAPTQNAKFYRVVLTAVDEQNKIPMIVLIRKTTPYSLKEATAAVETLPSVLIGGLAMHQAQQIKQSIEQLQSQAIIEPDMAAIEPNRDFAAKSDRNIVKCPRCGSTSITTGMRGWKLTIGFLGSSKTVNRCAKCGYTWTPSYSTRNR